MKLYDSLTQKVEKLDLHNVIKMYTCGITPYDAAHVGHAAVFTFYDVLQRRLRDLNVETRCVRNITDVDDDLLRKAREQKVNYLDLAAYEISRFDEDMKALSLLGPYSEPRATSAIQDILKHIDSLVGSSNAYSKDGFVYFDVKSVSDFGSLSHLSESEMIEVARERGGNPDDPNKRYPLDVVLWQPSLIDEPMWESRFGPGRPGWHIECVALSLREHNGETLDIHGGGSDLIFPHHECEKAQAETLMGNKFAKHWVHVGMVDYQGEKMSKSLGNLVFVHDLLEECEPEAIRLAILRNRYRDSWEWSDELLDDSRELWQRFSKGSEGIGALEGVRACLDDDMDTPSAIEELVKAEKNGEGICEALKLIGLRR